MSEHTQSGPDAAANPPAGATPAFRAIDFHGTGKEYFGIWISNLFLSIVTFGIYSAWAKVRRIKYFYNNTKLFDFPFNYHATGKQIFTGRLIAFAVMVVYSFVTAIFPLTIIPFSIAFMFGLPWLINRSLRFSARMTSWRNVRLDWHGTYGKSFLFFIVCPFVAVLSLGTLVPMIARYYYRYFAEGHSYGTTRFRADAKVSQYYKGFLTAALLPVLAAAGVALLLAAISAKGNGALTPAHILFFPIFAFLFFFQVMYHAICRNILLRSMTLGEVATFDSQVSPLKFLWIGISNAAAVLVSLGLLMPWAMIRRYRYLAESTGVGLSEASHEFLDAQTQTVGAFGQEFIDLDGIDIGI